MHLKYTGFGASLIALEYVSNEMMLFEKDVAFSEFFFSRFDVAILFVEFIR